MKNNFEMVVFDMAGTTIDEGNVVYKMLHQSFLQVGFDCSLDQVLTVCAGKEKRQAVNDLLQQINYLANAQQGDQIYLCFKEKLAQAYTHLKVVAQQNAELVFEKLKQHGIKVVLNTGYDFETAMSLLKQLNWNEGQTFDYLVTASDVVESRPAPDMIFMAMSQFGISRAAKVIKVGDSIIDIEEGRSAGCGMVVGITTGAQTYEQLQTAKPDFVITNLNELLPLL